MTRLKDENTHRRIIQNNFCLRTYFIRLFSLSSLISIVSVAGTEGTFSSYNCEVSSVCTQRGPFIYDVQSKRCRCCNDQGEMCDCTDTIDHHSHVPVCKNYFGSSGRVCFTDCPAGTYTNMCDVDDYECKPCSNVCRTCDGPGPDHCLKCEMVSDGRCVSSCPSGHFLKTPHEFSGSSAILGQCLKYSYCDGVIHKDSCVPSCPESYFAESSGDYDICTPCTIHCTKCVGPKTEDCTSCTNVKLSNGTCAVECPASHPFNNEQSMCGDIYECLVMYNTDYCARYCQLYGMVLLPNDTCAENCTPLHPFRNENGVCLDICPDLSWGHECVASCPSRHFMIYNGTCISKCPYSSPLINQNNHCVSVNECTPTGSIYEGRCFEHCHRGQVSVFGRCEHKCPPNAPFLDTEGYCKTTCLEDQVVLDGNCRDDCPGRLVSYNGSCVSRCPFNRPVINLVNKTCSEKCTQVTHGDFCLTKCPDTHPFVINKTCTKVCPGEAPVVSWGECLPECPHNMLLLRDGGSKTCVKACPNNQYVLNNTCVARCPKNMAYSIDQRCYTECPLYTKRINNDLDGSQCMPCEQTDDKYADPKGVCVRHCPVGSVPNDVNLRSCIPPCINNSDVPSVERGGREVLNPREESWAISSICKFPGQNVEDKKLLDYSRCPACEHSCTQNMTMLRRKRLLLSSIPYCFMSCESSVPVLNGSFSVTLSGNACVTECPRHTIGVNRSVGSNGFGRVTVCFQKIHVFAERALAAAGGLLLISLFTGFLLFQILYRKRHRGHLTAKEIGIILHSWDDYYKDVRVE